MTSNGPTLHHVITMVDKQDQNLPDVMYPYPQHRSLQIEAHWIEEGNGLRVIVYWTIGQRDLPQTNVPGPPDRVPVIDYFWTRRAASNLEFEAPLNGHMLPPVYGYNQGTIGIRVRRRPRLVFRIWVERWAPPFPDMPWVREWLWQRGMYVEWGVEGTDLAYDINWHPAWRVWRRRPGTDFAQPTSIHDGLEFQWVVDP